MSALDELQGATEGGLPSPDELKSISFLVTQAKNLEGDMAKMAAELKEKQTEHRKLLEVDIPQAMLEAGGGITSIKMEDGTKVDVIPFINASISEANRAGAFAWMRENGYGDLIKRVISAQFGMGDDEDAANAYNLLGNEGYSVTDKESVHPSSLKSQVKKWDESGENFPEDLFGVYRGMTTKIKAG